MDKAIDVSGLTKSYGAFLAVDHIIEHAIQLCDRATPPRILPTANSGAAVGSVHTLMISPASQATEFTSTKAVQTLALWRRSV